MAGRRQPKKDYDSFVGDVELELSKRVPGRVVVEIHSPDFRITGESPVIYRYVEKRMWGFRGIVHLALPTSCYSSALDYYAPTSQGEESIRALDIREYGIDKLVRQR